MARGLQCPACDERHRIDGAAPGSTFKCGGCSRTLRVPGAEATTVEPVAANATSEAGSARPDSASQVSASPNRIRLPPYEGALPLAARIVSWVIALPIAGFIALKIAVLIGLLSTNDLIDLITGSGGGRYLRLVIFIPLWALITVGVVSLLLEVGERLLANYGQSLSSANPQVAASQRPRNRTNASARQSTNASPNASTPVADKTRVNPVVMPDRTITNVATDDDEQRPRRIPPR